MALLSPVSLTEEETTPLEVAVGKKRVCGHFGGPDAGQVLMGKVLLLQSFEAETDPRSWEQAPRGWECPLRVTGL